VFYEYDGRAYRELFAEEIRARLYRSLEPTQVDGKHGRRKVKPSRGKVDTVDSPRAIRRGHPT
jgi:hypothetical protein